MKSYYTISKLKRRIRFKEIINSGQTSVDFFQDVEEDLENLRNGTFTFNLSVTANFCKVNKLSEKIILRQANFRLKKTYKDNQSNRQVIIKQIKSLLSETSSYSIIRTDVSSFYESIIVSDLVDKIKSDRILTYETIYLIDNILDQCSPHYKGLPRGLSISSTLSEIYMRSFDKTIRRHPSVYYYARFVDDIIIFMTSEEEKDILLKKMETELPEGMNLNKKKTYDTNIDEIVNRGDCFEYLGYKFSVQKESRDKFTPIVSIADKKINKIKYRITKSFVQYAKDNDFNMLKKRIDFLSSNYVLRGGKSANLMAGISYNYHAVNVDRDFDEINQYYHSLLNCKKNSLYRLLNGRLSNHQIGTLSKISFKHRFKSKAIVKFSPSLINDIKLAWV